MNPSIPQGIACITDMRNNSKVRYEERISNILSNQKRFGYHTELPDKIKAALQDKWSRKLNEEYHIEILVKACTYAKHISPTIFQYYNQFMLIHRRAVNTRLLEKMGISLSDKCLLCKDQIKTIEHIYLQCENVNTIWMETEKRDTYDSHFKISELFGGIDNNPITQTIIISVKYVIYQKRNKGKI